MKLLQTGRKLLYLSSIARASNGRKTETRRRFGCVKKRARKKAGSFFIAGAAV
jgi:hypothetical protein